MNSQGKGGKRYKTAFFCILTFLFLLSGCSSISVKSLTPDDIGIQKKNDSTASLRVAGFPNEPTFVNLTNQFFTQALKTSLTNTGVFSKVLADNGVDYRLDVLIANFTHSTWGGTAIVEVAWMLTKVESNSVIWQEVITTQSESSAFGGVARFNESASGAIKENIKKGVQNLSSHVR